MLAANQQIHHLEGDIRILTQQVGKDRPFHLEQATRLPGNGAAKPRTVLEHGRFAEELARSDNGNGVLAALGKKQLDAAGLDDIHRLPLVTLGKDRLALRRIKV